MAGPDDKAPRNDSDPHTSPENPDNRIGLDRHAADDENREQILQNAPETILGTKKPERPRKAVRRSSKKVAEVQSTGHSWDGIEEYDNPLPRWWLWTFYATIIWAVGYVIAYPAIPLIHGNTHGVIGGSNRVAVVRDIARFQDMNAAVNARLAEVPLDEIRNDPELVNYANNAGKAVFQIRCAQCHGSGAGGNPGYPNLLDNDWLWGGTMDAIHTTLLHGIRSPTDPDTRYSEMPKFGADGILDDRQINQVTNYVLALADEPHDAGLAQAGQELFADNCSACHGENGTGDREQGAPNLTDAVWLYSKDGRANPAIIRRTIHDGPFGVMPAWGEQLSESEIRAVATYVHGLGGGE